MSRIPDRWLNYTSIGKQIDVTPFLAFKVPLKDSFLNGVPLEQKFGPADLIQLVPNLSLVIDLTNTGKYYNGNEFRKSGIQYQKLFCPGHQIPPKDLIKRFFEIVDDFMKQKNNNDGKDDVGLIGVHCTHGINRTGFFICSYMINKMGYDSEKAISEFNSARGHDIERMNYVAALKKYDVERLDFPTSEHSDADSGSRFTHEDSANDRRYVPEDSFRRRRPFENNSYGRPHHYGNDYRSRPRHFQNNHYQSHSQDRHFYRDHPPNQSWRNGNSNRRNDSRPPFVTNPSPLESIDPYFGPDSYREYGNSRYRHRR